MTQSRLTVWTHESGLPQNTIDAIVQTRDGYLWMGTEEGFVRFDGLRFVVHDRQNTPALRSSFVSSLFEASDGTLWIGTYGGGLVRLRNRRIEAFHPELLGTDRLREMYESANGVLFAATAGGGLLRIEGDHITRTTMRNGLPSDRLWALEADSEGGLWIGTHGAGVVHWRDSRVVRTISMRDGLPNDLARAILRERDGTLWIGTDGGGVVEWKDGAVARVITTRDGLPNDHIRSLRRDRDGSLWIGTDTGLARWRDGRAESLGVAQGLPSATIRAVIEDREGSLWVGTTGGVARLRDTRFLPFTRKEGLPVDAARPLLEDRSGRMWVGTEGGGLCEIFARSAQCRTKADGLPHDTVYALAEGRDGSLWIGTDGGGVARFRDDRVVEVFDAQRTGLPNDRVRALAENAAGDLWVSTTSGLALVRNGRAIRVKELEDRQLRPLLMLPDGDLLVGTDGAGLWRVSRDGAHATVVAATGRGLRSDRIFSLAADSRGRAVWIGTSGGGLARLDLATGAVRSLTRRDGLHDDVVFQIVDEPRTGDLWLTSNRGLYRVKRDEVLSAMSGAKADLSGRVFGTTDGMPSPECNAGFPSAIRTRDGRLWVSTARGVAVVDPSVVSRNQVAPLVHIDEMLVDGRPAAGGSLRVPAGAQRLELRYTAASLWAPELVTFNYMLEGYDTEWVDAGTNRVATYTKLAPGRYTFRVKATNEDGVASVAEARIPILVDPRWFETWWARFAAIAMLAAALWGGLRLRLAAMHRRQAELEALVAERTSQLRALSYVDGLTGIANRRHFDESLADACSAAGQRGTPVSLVLLDLDHFKHLNDSRGHQEGDEALRAVAALLAERTKSRGGLAARFGGEEFAWLLPGVALDAATAEAELLRLRVRDAGIRHDGAQSGVVTASLGVSSCSGSDNPQPLALIAAADAALYRAKAGGRDRVETQLLR